MKLPSRKLAEWITLVISAVVFLSVVFFLVLDLSETPSEYLEITATPLFSQIKKQGKLYILPLEVRNSGIQTLTAVKVRVSFGAKDQSAQEDIEIQYLPRQSAQKVYLNFERDPRLLDLKAKPVYYYFD
jgi:uncharacterized protein (TIGR02588 family)